MCLRGAVNEREPRSVARGSERTESGGLPLSHDPVIKNDKVANEINELMLELYRQMQESIDNVKITCSDEEYQAYNQAVGIVVGTILRQVLEPLYRDNPALKPPGWDE